MRGTSVASPHGISSGTSAPTFVEVIMRRSLIVLALTAVASASAAPSFAGPFTVTTLATKATDAGLINPWGLASSGGARSGSASTAAERRSFTTEPESSRASS